MIRAASLRGLVPLVQTLDRVPATLLARHGLAEADPSSDDSLISITSHDLLLDAAADELRCPDLGLRVAESQDLRTLGPLAVAIEASPTVSEGLANARGSCSSTVRL